MSPKPKAGDNGGSRTTSPIDPRRKRVLGHFPRTGGRHARLQGFALLRCPQRQEQSWEYTRMADIALDPAAAAPAQPRFAPVSAGYGRYALALLVAIYTVNFLDRQIITTIGEAKK